MDEQRLIELEMKISHQDALLEELNEVVTKQQETIDLLEAKVKSLLQRFQDSAEETAAHNEKPPHY
jgi:SlyX protein